MGVRVEPAAGPLALGCQGSACDRLRLTGGLRALALGRYEVLWRSCIGPPSQPKLALSLPIKGPTYWLADCAHWGGTAPSAPFFIPPLAAKTIQPPCGRGKTGQPCSARGNATGGGSSPECFSCHMTESQSRNADFILIARRAIPQPSEPQALSPPERKRRNPFTQPAAEPRPLFYKTCGVSRHHHPLNPLNLHTEGVSIACPSLIYRKNLFFLLCLL